MLVFYVSGHGFGHATRSRAVIDELRQMVPSLPVCVRTAAPPEIFGPDVRVDPVNIEPAMVESSDALSIDNPASLRNLEEYLNGLESVVAREAEWVSEHGVKLIAADIPFTAGFIAHRAGLPAVAIGNFTWDWIFENAEAPAEALAMMRQGYSHFRVALRLPLSQPANWESFREVTDVGLLSPRSVRSRAEILQELGLAHEKRKIVLVGGRARLSPDLFSRIEQENSEFVFLTHNALPNYHDLVRACDLVVSKIGYSIAAECIAEEKGILFPPRAGFAEEAILAAAVPRYTRCLPIPVEEWQSGRWKPWLAHLAEAAPPNNRMNLDGAKDCAALISRLSD